MKLNQFLKSDGKTDFRCNFFQSWIIRCAEALNIQHWGYQETTLVQEKSWCFLQRLRRKTKHFLQKCETCQIHLGSCPSCVTQVIVSYSCTRVRDTPKQATLCLLCIFREEVPAVSKVKRLVWMTALWSSLKRFAYPSWLAPQFSTLNGSVLFLLMLAVFPFESTRIHWRSMLKIYSDFFFLLSCSCEDRWH